MQTISKMKMGEDVKDEVAEMEVLDSNDEDETGKDKVGPDVKRRKLLSKSESGRVYLDACLPEQQKLIQGLTILFAEIANRATISSMGSTQLSASPCIINELDLRTSGNTTTISRYVHILLLLHCKSFILLPVCCFTLIVGINFVYHKYCR